MATQYSDAEVQAWRNRMVAGHEAGKFTVPQAVLDGDLDVCRRCMQGATQQVQMARDVRGGKSYIREYGEQAGIVAQFPRGTKVGDTIHQFRTQDVAGTKMWALIPWRVVALETAVGETRGSEDQWTGEEREISIATAVVVPAK